MGSAGELHTEHDGKLVMIFNPVTAAGIWLKRAVYCVRSPRPDGRRQLRRPAVAGVARATDATRVVKQGTFIMGICLEINLYQKFWVW